MPAAVNDRPPRKGPISRYWSPLNGFSSGLVSSGPVLGDFCSAALGGFDVSAAGLIAFDWRSVFTCATLTTAGITKKVSEPEKATSKVPKNFWNGRLVINITDSPPGN